MSIFDNPGPQAIALDKLQLHASHMIDKHALACMRSAEISSYENYIADSLVLTLRAYILGAEKERTVESSVEVPATWWDAVKERWLERWGWKVERKTIQTVVRTWKVCPHLEIPKTDQHRHIYWVAGKVEDCLVVDQKPEITCSYCGTEYLPEKGRCPRCGGLDWRQSYTSRDGIRGEH